MADVYGFNEAKSKIKVVDKATQDATDLAQNNRVTALETKWANAVLDSATPDGATGNEIATAGWVKANAGGTVPTEYYGDVVENDNLSGTITLSGSVSISTGKAVNNTFYITKMNINQSADSLYYDKGNATLKRAITSSPSYGNSGSLKTTRYNQTAFTADDGDFHSIMISALEGFLVGKTISYNTTVYLRISTNIVVGVNLNYSSGLTISGIKNISYYNTDVTLRLAAGTHNVSWVYLSSWSPDTQYPIPTTTPKSIPSTYKKIIDL